MAVAPLPPTPTAPSSPLADLLIFLGDLNYRVSGFKPSIMQAMGLDKYDLLINGDQLNFERALGNIPKFF